MPLKFYGKWKSEVYNDATAGVGIYGTFVLNIPSVIASCEPFEAEMSLHYDEKSTYKANETINIILEGLYDCSKQDNYRIVMRQGDFDISQYFTLTLSSNNKVKWIGYLTCIFPVDMVKLYEVMCESIPISKIEDINVENISITI